jgi:predicted nucleotidyltransferase
MGSLSIHKLIKETVHADLPDCRIVLFGSHARGDYDTHSDYDLLIITPLKLSPKEKINLSTRLDQAIVKVLKIPVDILINSEEEVKEKRELPGHIVRTAMREGVDI